jgi:hypothetical protein
MRSLAIVIVLLPACIRENVEVCGDKICPIGAICLADRDTCATQDQLDACAGMADGTLCSYGLVDDGWCDRGLCTATTCGDGNTTGREQCDGSVNVTCADFRYYYGEVTCTSNCLYDSSACNGRCGDGMVQLDMGEVCDGNKPPLGCVDLGYDYGHIGCTSRCTDSSLTDCGHFAPIPFFADPPQAINGASFLDVFRDKGVTYITGYTDGLVIIDHGVKTVHAGVFPGFAPTTTALYTANQTEVDQIVDDKLVPMPDPGVTSSIVGLAATPTDELWLVTNSCEVRVLANNVWTTRPPPMNSGCFAGRTIAADGAGNVYLATGGATSQAVAIEHWNGAGWTTVPGVTSINQLNLDGAGRLLVATATDVFLVAGDTATSLGIPGSWLDAIGIGDQTLALGATTAMRAGPGPGLSLPSLGGFADHARRMPDGSVVLWSTRAFDLPQIIEIPPTVRATSGVRAGTPGGYVLWDSAKVTASSGTHNVTGTIIDVAVAPNNTVYVATTNGLTWGVPGSGGWTSDNSVAPSWVRVLANGDVAIIDAPGNVRIRPSGSSTWQTVPYFGSFIAVVGSSPTDLYAVTPTGPSCGIEHYDGTSWTELTTFDVLGFGICQATGMALLPDGTLAVAGSQSVIGKDQSWTILPVTSGYVDALSRSKIWFADVTDAAHPTASLEEWDGNDLAPIRWEDPTPDGLAFTGDVAVVTTGGFVRTFSLWAVP